MTSEKDIATLSEPEVRAELEELASKLSAANQAYHTDDAPDISDAEYDRLKRRNAALEAAFPSLKRADSPSEQVGAPIASGFSKITHVVPMLSLGNAFEDDDVSEVMLKSNWESDPVWACGMCGFFCCCGVCSGSA